MPYCPECRTEYWPGVLMCADCGVPLVDYLPEEPETVEPPPEPAEPPVVVFETVNWAEAEVLKAKLEFYGIPAVLMGETAQRGLYTPGVSALAPIRILVPADRAEEAREILQQQEQFEGDEP